MRVLHLALAFVVALSSINDGVTSASKATLSSDSSDYPALRVSIASDKTNSEERRPIGVFGPVGKGNGGYGKGARKKAVTLPPGTYVGPEFGGYSGREFTDAAFVKSGQKVLSINLRAGERVDAVILTIVKPFGGERTLYHGGDGGDMKNPLTLTEGEYITVMEAHAGDHDGSTRVKYIKFTTNKGNFIEGGTRTDKNGTDTAKEGYQLGGFVGRSGDELDLVSVIWTSIEPVG
ncbi:hypothetical protein PPTG_01841 [Phytophthora nicotianae INRA-310]|uniref:Jacalin-type lectin domain-containing protein n=3 Tax=Phytophthora nicotianae TaxID=4792 RepID=W2RB04_PHYN3|nr:hypothetical protein PPTG_01841 [Phytophthora nicotianae INRA-310]ETN21725.1 hypothetical protein PPTG_01841 [Phytophthora nicotianae INRA-310]KUG01409.1 hypothetical protein AM587_10008855 [Phytophthora nicotianae]KUG01415.1 hypothetical protein AM587_10008851 [Phytophthora nicotianae]